MHLKACRLILVVLLTSPAPIMSFYVPGVAPTDFEKGDPVEIKVCILRFIAKITINKPRKTVQDRRVKSDSKDCIHS